MDDDEFNKKLNNLIDKNKVLEKTNKEFEERLQKAEDNIKNLNRQLIFLRLEYTKAINNLEKKYNSIKDNKSKQISQLDEKYHNKNEINEIIDKEQNNNEVNNKIRLSMTQKNIQIPNKYGLLLPIIEIKLDKKHEKKINDNINKFEKNLTKIYDSIPQNIEYDLKKISKALIIQGKDPLLIKEDFFQKLLNNKKKKGDSIQNMEIKDKIIKEAINKILKGFENIIKSDDKEFRIKFREKYGITEKNMSDKKLNKLIEKHKGNEDLIIKELLINLNYILKEVK